MLQQAIRESAIRRSNVKADTTINVNPKICERAFQFQSAAAGVFQAAAGNFDWRVRRKHRSRLRGRLAIDAYFACHNHCSRDLLCRGKSSRNEKFIEPGLEDFLRGFTAAHVEKMRIAAQPPRGGRIDAEPKRKIVPTARL